MLINPVGRGAFRISYIGRYLAGALPRLALRHVCIYTCRLDGGNRN
jgi:hypothetical protein